MSRSIYGTGEKRYLEIAALVSNHNGRLLTDHYLGSGELYDVSCAVGHLFRIKANNIKYGSWCPACAGIRHYERIHENTLFI